MNRNLWWTGLILAGALACDGDGFAGLPVTSLRLALDTLEIVVAGTAWLVPHDALGNPAGRVRWTSAHPSIATVVDSGLPNSFPVAALVTGAAPGTTVVRAEANGHRDSVVVEVAVISFTTSSGPCGLTTTGMTYCWDEFSPRPLPPGTPGEGASPTAPARLNVPRLVTLSVGLGQACGLTAGGLAYCWTQAPSPYAVPTAVPAGVPFTAISAGSVNSTCGLDGSGRALCWSLVYAGNPTAVPGGLSFAAISTGPWHRCALTSLGAAYCWGNSQYGQLGRTDSLQTCSGGYLGMYPYPCSDTPVAVGGGHAFTSLSAGFSHSCALTADGHAYCWGSNRAGQLGVETVTDVCPLELGYSQTIPCSATPVAVGRGLTFSSLSAGGDYTCGVTVGGSAYCWGINYDGFLGDGSTTTRSYPQPVTGGHTFSAVSASGSQTCGLTIGGILYCWGGGALGNGTFANSSVPCGC